MSKYQFVLICKMLLGIMSAIMYGRTDGNVKLITSLTDELTNHSQSRESY